jgi:hypothetical protein
VLVYLSVEAVGKRLVFSEAGEQGHPVVELEGLLFNT